MVLWYAKISYCWVAFSVGIISRRSRLSMNPLLVWLTSSLGPVYLGNFFVQGLTLFILGVYEQASDSAPEATLSCRISSKCYGVCGCLWLFLVSLQGFLLSVSSSVFLACSTLCQGSVPVVRSLSTNASFVLMVLPEHSFHFRYHLIIFIHSKTCIVSGTTTAQLGTKPFSLIKLVVKGTL